MCATSSLLSEAKQAVVPQDSPQDAWSMVVPQAGWECDHLGALHVCLVQSYDGQSDGSKVCHEPVREAISGPAVEGACGIPSHAYSAEEYAGVLHAVYGRPHVRHAGSDDEVQGGGYVGYDH